jgi:nucleotide-binding universal stress UspA family protein
MLKLLIAVDGSEHARRALQAVARLAPQVIGLEVVLLNVCEDPLYYAALPPVDHASIQRLQHQRQHALLAEVAAEAAGLGLARVSTRGEEGAPADAIVRVAAECAADQIVMGTHGRGALGSLFIGSVAQRVAHLAAVPVLLVK